MANITIVDNNGLEYYDEKSLARMNTELNKKVDKISGKGLSTNDYTTDEKNKLAGIAAGANKTTVDSALSSTSTNPVQNKVINTALNSKANSSHKHDNADINSLDASKLTGTIDIARLPQGALDRLVKVANDDVRLALTTDDIQLGDTVKVISTGKMYYVVDETKLSSEDGYEPYTADTATSVPWTGVTGKPSSYTPSSHTHDDRYYTETEMNTKLAGKSDTGHKHTKSEITDFPTSLPANGGNSATVNNHTVNADVPSGAKFTDTVYTHPTTSGNKHIPSGGSSGQILRWSADGTAVWDDDNNTTYNNMSGATSSTDGKSGLVPAPSAGDQDKFFCADGTWKVVETGSSHDFVLQEDEPTDQIINDEWCLEY